MKKESQNQGSRISARGQYNGMLFTDVLSGVPTAVAALTALIFTASAAREWAYYYGLGAADFISLVSPADYTSADLLWLPAFMLLGAVIAVLEMFLLRTEEFLSEEKIAERSSNPRPAGSLPDCRVETRCFASPARGIPGRHAPEWAGFEIGSRSPLPGPEPEGRLQSSEESRDGT